MEDVKKLKVKKLEGNSKGQKNLERLGWEGENPQRVVVPNDDDDDFIYVHLMVCYINTIIFLTIYYWELLALNKLVSSARLWICEVTVE